MPKNWRIELLKIITITKCITYVVKSKNVRDTVTENFRKCVAIIVHSLFLPVQEMPTELYTRFVYNQSKQVLFTNNPLFRKGPYLSLVATRGKLHIFQVMYLNFPGPQQCLASPDILFNLNKRFSVLGKSIFAFIYPFLKESFISCAKQAKIATIHSCKNQSDPSDCLSRLFANPFYCQTGDIVESEGFVFQIVEVSSEETQIGPFIHKDSTTLYQIASVPSLFSPKRLRLTLCSQLKRPERLSPSTFIETLPPCFRKDFSQIIALVQPFLLDHIEGRHGKISFPTYLFQGVPGSGKRCLATVLAESLGLTFVEINCSSLITESNKATESRFTTAFEAIKGPSLVFVTNVELVGKSLDGHTNTRLASFIQAQIKSLATKKFPVIVIGSCSVSDIQPLVAVNFAHRFQLSALDNLQKEETLRWIFKDTGIELGEDEFNGLVQMTPGYKFGDLRSLITLTIRTKVKKELEYNDLERANETMKSWRSSMKGTPSMQKITWDDVGGLKPIIQELLDMIELPMKYPELLESGLCRSGILLYGPPGTGKTLLARALASQAGLHFLSVKGPELLNMYIGQSEQNVRAVFQRAREASPCLVFFDELDSLAPNRGRSGDSGGVMDRVVSQLLAELDGMQKSTQVYIVGATNRPDLIDPALLRPGRFDKLIYLGVSESIEDKIAILKAQTHKFPLACDIDWHEIVSNVPESVTGADLYSLCADAMSKAISRQIAALEARGANNKLQVQLVDFLEAAQELVPSLSAVELASYKSVRAKMSNRS